MHWGGSVWKIKDADLHPMVRALLASYGQPAQPAASVEPMLYIQSNHVTCAQRMGPFMARVSGRKEQSDWVPLYAAPVAAQPDSDEDARWPNHTCIRIEKLNMGDRWDATCEGFGAIPGCNMIFPRRTPQEALAAILTELGEPVAAQPKSSIPVEDGIAWQSTGSGVKRTAVMVAGRSWYRDDDPKVAAQPGVPYGWKLVPVIPTDSMVSATFSPRISERSKAQFTRHHRTMLANAIAAAPTPPADGQAQQDGQQEARHGR